MKGFRRSKDDAIALVVIPDLRSLGRQCFRTDGMKRDHPGIPDWIIVWGGGWCWLELKAPGKQLNANQVAWWAAYRGPPGTLRLARSVAEARKATGL